MSLNEICEFYSDFDKSLALFEDDNPGKTQDDIDNDFNEFYNDNEGEFYEYVEKHKNKYYYFLDELIFDSDWFPYDTLCRIRSDVTELIAGHLCLHPSIIVYVHPNAILPGAY